jgi:ech hydrogenase subunit C
MSFLKKSPWVIHYDGSSCNGCDIEVLACLTPVYDVERLGVINTGNPKHADILLLTGSINEQNREVVGNLYEQMPDPKVVVAIGICATSGGIFAECYNVMGGANKVVPVDVYVPGCAARPESIIDGVVQALSVLDIKRSRYLAVALKLKELDIDFALPEDAAEVLALQKLAYQSEAEIYHDFNIAPLVQTLDEMKEDFKKMTFFKAVISDRVVGSVRAFREGDTCFISRLVVHPSYQNFGIGRKLMNMIEGYFSGAPRLEVHTGQKSKRNIIFYKRLGYRIFKSARITDARERVYMEKIRAKGPYA